MNLTIIPASSFIGHSTTNCSAGQRLRVGEMNNTPLALAKNGIWTTARASGRPRDNMQGKGSLQGTVSWQVSDELVNIGVTGCGSDDRKSAS